MDLSKDVKRAFARQDLKTLERLGADPELARTFAEALDKTSTNEARAEHSEKEAERAKRELTQTRAKLAEFKQTRAKLAELTATNKNSSSIASNWPPIILVGVISSRILS